MWPIQPRVLRGFALADCFNVIWLNFFAAMCRFLNCAGNEAIAMLPQQVT